MLPWVEGQGSSQTGWSKLDPVAQHPHLSGGQSRAVDRQAAKIRGARTSPRPGSAAPEDKLEGFEAGCGRTGRKAVHKQLRLAFQVALHERDVALPAGRRTGGNDRRTVAAAPDDPAVAVNRQARGVRTGGDRGDSARSVCPDLEGERK